MLSEILQDVDLLVGVCSIGNDPEWTDHGQRDYNDYWRSYSFGELGASAKCFATSSRLLPKLAIADRASLNGLSARPRRAARVQDPPGSGDHPHGAQRPVPVHRARRQEGADDVMLPFAGDRGLALVLSKALMLADDTHIDDPTIVSQITS